MEAHPSPVCIDCEHPVDPPEGSDNDGCALLCIACAMTRLLAPASTDDRSPRGSVPKDR